MKLHQNRFLFLFIAALSALSAFADAESDRELAVEGQGIYKTYVPSRLGPIPFGEFPSSGEITASPETIFAAPPYSVLNLATVTSTPPEAEEYITVDPTRSTALVAVISDFSLRGGYNTTKYSFSADNGSPGTWVQHFVPLKNGYPVTADGMIWEANSDPVVGMDLAGNVYLSNLYFNASNDANGLYVSVANMHTQGPSFQFNQAQTIAVVTHPQPNTNLSEDKPWLAVDDTLNVNSGNVYVSWTHFVGNSPTGILFSRSTDQGQSWTAPIQVSPAFQSGAIQGSSIAIGAGGEIYVAYEVFYIGGYRRHFLAKSTNAGSSFSAPVPITPYFNELNFSSTYRKNSFPQLAGNPAIPGAVYDLYSDQPTRYSRVEFTRSANGGNSFSAPVGVNNVSTGQHFMPAITVDPFGVIHASWFDTRNSPRGTSYYDIYAARSNDAGSTFSPNTRVTPFLVTADSVSFIGDYAGITAAGGFAHPVWTSGGFNNGLLQTATLR